MNEPCRLRRGERYGACPDVVRLKGLEPPTHCLEGSCSIHLSYRRILCLFQAPRRESPPFRGPRKAVPQALWGKEARRSERALAAGRSEGYAVRADVERVMGIEPTRPAWKAGILPLNYTRMATPQRSAQT